MTEPIVTAISRDEPGVANDIVEAVSKLENQMKADLNKDYRE